MINSPSIWGALSDAGRNGVFHLVSATAPTNAITGKGVAGKGCLCTALDTGLLYVNTGTIDSPVWAASARDIGDTANIWAARFQTDQAVPLSDNQPTVTLSSGIRIFGNGLADNDSGMTVAITPEGSIGTLVTSANAGETIAAGVGTTGTLPYKPAINGPISIQAVVQMVTDHLNRKFFIGFLGNPIDAILAPETFSAGNFTLNQSNLAGLVTDTGVGTTRDLYALSNKVNATPVISALSALTPAAFPVTNPSVWTKLKVVVDVDGTATFYVDDVLVKTIPNALDPNVPVAPVLLLGNTLNGAVRMMNVKQFICLGN